MPVVAGNRVSYTVQVASPLSTIDSALTTLKLVLFLLLPLTVALAAIIGGLLAKIALHPVASMIDAVRQITAENMQSRLPIPHSKDEIRTLADTFNEMLGRLEQAFSSQQQFIEDFAHGIKTPLAVLKGEMEVALKRVRSKAEYESILLSNLEEANRICRVVEDLLMIARLDSRTIMPERKPVDVGHMLKGAADEIKVLADPKSIGVDCPVGDAMIVSGDETQLKRLFMGLLDNAVAYTRCNGTVALRMEPEDGYARITVSDTGIGIPANNIDCIFDRFYRLDTSHHAQGFGLGLSIAKSIVEAHNGRIEVVSKVDQGTTFTVYLPIYLPLFANQDSS